MSPATRKFRGIPYECEDGDHEGCRERECFCPCHEEDFLDTEGAA